MAPDGASDQWDRRIAFALDQRPGTAWLVLSATAKAMVEVSLPHDVIRKTFRLALGRPEVLPALQEFEPRVLDELLRPTTSRRQRRRREATGAAT